MIKIGIITFSDGKDIVNDKLKPVNNSYINLIANKLKQTSYIEPIIAKEIVHNSVEAKEQAQYLRSKNCHGIIFNFAIWSYPNLSVIASGFFDVPILMFGNNNPEYPGLVGMLASAGSLSMLGRKHLRLFGDVNDDKIFKKILEFAKASYAITELKGQVYGIVGGRSMGMYTAVPCLTQWQKEFGVDIEHIDQLEIIRLSSDVSNKKVEDALIWLEKNVGNINYDNNKLTKEVLRTQIRHYYATKKIIENYKLDFIGVKCHDELSSNYCTQCISAAFINDPYDFDGPKEPFVYSCEADSDGALTMQVLKMITGLPVLFMDIRHFDEGRNHFVFCNCGSQSTFYAMRSNDYRVNLKEISLEPAGYLLKGCGANIQYIAREGEMTLARFMREDDKYWLAVLKGRAVTMQKEVLKETTFSWPHVYFKTQTKPEELFKKYSSNHCHGVYGDYTQELINFCFFKGIHYIIYG